MSKFYSLFLHYKQGDDFQHILSNTKDNSEAFLHWAESFEQNATVCYEIAKALDGQHVTIDAGTHMINLSPDDEQAESVLNKLVIAKLISVEDFEDEDECDDTGCGECDKGVT